MPATTDNSVSELSEELQSNSSNATTISPKKVNGVFPCVPYFFNSILIEPVWILFAIGDSIIGMIVQTYYIDRICRISKGYDSNICQNLTQYSIEEKEVERDASELTMYKTLIESGFPIILALFVGPLTDKYGYKPLMLYSLSGYMLYMVGMISTCFMPTLPPKYLLISSIPIGLSGGVVTLIISSYGYMATQTTSSNRTTRLAVLSAVWDIGTVVGFICGSKTFHRESFLPAFLYTFAFYSLSFLYTMTQIHERKPDQTELLGSSQSSSLFIETCSLEPIKEVFCAAFKARPGQRRKSIIVIVTATCLTFLAYASKSYQYLFVRNRFGWDAERFSQFSAINTFLSGAGSFILTLFFMKLLKFRDIYTLLVTSISNLSAYSIYATAQTEWHIFLGSGVQMFGSLTTTVFKSMLTSCVNKDEYGKLLSFVICAELSMPFISGPLYNFVYVETVTTLPGAVFLVAAAFTAIVLVLCGVLHILTKNIGEYSLVLDDDE